VRGSAAKFLALAISEQSSRALLQKIRPRLAVAFPAVCARTESGPRFCRKLGSAENAPATPPPLLSPIGTRFHFEYSSALFYRRLRRRGISSWREGFLRSPAPLPPAEDRFAVESCDFQFLAYGKNTLIAHRPATRFWFSAFCGRTRSFAATVSRAVTAKRSAASVILFALSLRPQISCASGRMGCDRSLFV
jgi:hypothetical protein